MTTLPLFLLAAVAEIAGCFAFWSWARLGRSVLWLVPGVMALIVFAWLLTRADVAYAGRAFAAYGGVYVVASLGWLFVVEGQRPDRWDIVGAVIILCGTALILFGPRSA